MKHVATKTTFLQMLRPGMPLVEPPLPGVTVQQLRSPSVAEYRHLYDSVGSDYQWVDRKMLADDKLKKIIEHELVDIHVLEVDREPAGFAELDRRTRGQVEVAYFGLCPNFIGQGLGKYFLVRILELAWAHQPARVWLHTCDLDHPAALGNYLKVGFAIFDETIVQQKIVVE